MDNQKNNSVHFVHKEPGYGNDTPNPSKIAPPPPKPKK